MKVKDLTEGAMKRSDPYISGEKDPAWHPRHPPLKAAPTKEVSAHEKKLIDLASRANVKLDKVKELWAHAKSTVDPKLPNRWAVVMAKVKRDLKL